MHHLVPGTFVVHSHATIVNTLTCHTGGKQLAEEIFGDDIVWLPYVDPGFVLGQKLKQVLQDHAARTGGLPAKAILMENHGLIVAGDDAETIRRHMDEVLDKIAARLGDDWATKAFGEPATVRATDELVRRLGPALRGLLADDATSTLKVVTFDDSEITRGVVSSAAGQATVCAGPMTPDQIVYCGSFPMWFEAEDDEADDSLVERVRRAIAEHREKARFVPKVVLVDGVGLFAAGDDYKQAGTVRDVYLDAIKVMAGATRLGGVSRLSDRDRRFIEDWEAESYRKQAAATDSAGRLQGKVAVVTGAAQGFGLEISQGLAAQAPTWCWWTLTRRAWRPQRKNCRISTARAGDWGWRWT